MQTITVSEGQCILDIAVQYPADAGRAVDLALLNGLGITDELEIGQALSVPDADITKQAISKLYKQRALIPASTEAVVFNDDGNPLEGIDYWAINADFIVS